MTEWEHWFIICQRKQAARKVAERIAKNNSICTGIITKTEECLDFGKYAFLNQAAEAHLDARERELLKARFVDGRKWSECAILMNAVHPFESWNGNKIFRTYRSIKL